MRGILRVKAIGFGPGTVAAWHSGRDRELGVGHFTVGEGGKCWVQVWSFFWKIWRALE